MKVAYWMAGIFILGLFGVVMIDLFGNITVTNQLNYTTMKNAVEASMYDALDIPHYRIGFCLCTSKAKVNGKWSFKDDEDYTISDITYDEKGTEKCSPKTSTEKCEILRGEYHINRKVFTEGLTRRIAEMVNNNKDYRVVVQEVIEYPPKVSVRVDSSDDNVFPTDPDSGGFTIVNQMDSIIETWIKQGVKK